MDAKIPWNIFKFAILLSAFACNIRRACCVSSSHPAVLIDIPVLYNYSYILWLGGGGCSRYSLLTLLHVSTTLGYSESALRRRLYNFYYTPVWTPITVFRCYVRVGPARPVFLSQSRVIGGQHEKNNIVLAGNQHIFRFFSRVQTKKSYSMREQKNVYEILANLFLFIDIMLIVRFSPKHVSKITHLMILQMWHQIQTDKSLTYVF